MRHDSDVDQHQFSTACRAVAPAEQGEKLGNPSDLELLQEPRANNAKSNINYNPEKSWARVYQFHKFCLRLP
jgi:hypothetical protein